MPLVSNVDYARLAKMTVAEQMTAAEEFWQDLTDGLQPSSRKKLVVIVGQPGSGKSSLAKMYQKKNPQFVNLSGDSVAAYHPRLFKLAEIRPVRLNSKALDCYDNPVFRRPQDNPLDTAAEEKYPEEFTYETYINSACRLMIKGYDVILDTLPGEEPKMLASMGKRLGYEIQVVAAVVPKQMSEQNIILRFEKGQQRFEAAKRGELAKTAENVPHVYAKMRQAPEDLVYMDEFLQEMAEEYPLTAINPISGKVLAKGKDVPAAYVSELKRPLDKAEQTFVALRYRQIAALQQKRGASKYDVYVNRSAFRESR